MGRKDAEGWWQHTRAQCKASPPTGCASISLHVVRHKEGSTHAQTRGFVLRMCVLEAGGELLSLLALDSDAPLAPDASAMTADATHSASQTAVERDVNE